MNTSPLVTIPIFTFNGEKFLKEQLDSIFAQSYKNIEVIAFDDASTDKTVEILEEYRKSHGLVYHVNDHNSGLSENFYKALSTCNGDFIAPADQDDIWLNTKIENFVNNIGDNVLIYSKSIPVHEDGSSFEEYNKKKKINFISGQNNKAFFFFNCVSAHNMMFSKELFPHIEPVPEAIQYFDWWVAFIASCYGSITFFESPMVYYRRHSAQVTNVSRSKFHNPLKTLKYKDTIKREHKKRQLEILKAFYNLKIINDDTKRSLKTIIDHLSSLETGYFSKALYKYLMSIHNEVFALKEPERHRHLAKKLSRGIWYYRWRFYL